MGRRYNYVCKSCALNAAVSGGSDRGFHAHTQTFYCIDCESLMDIGITPTKWDDSIHKIMANFSYLTCPKCKGMRLKSWAEGEPCPKCGGEIDKGFLSVMWD